MECADGSLYTGVTTDLGRRLKEHLSRGERCAKYTRSHVAVSMRAAWSAADRASASRLEYRIKALTRAQKLDLIEGSVPKHFDLAEYSPISGFPKIKAPV